MTSYTPGPWIATDELYIATADGGCLIAKVETENVDDRQYAVADARLIAAAPELVKALAGLMEYAGGWDAPAQHPCGIAAALLARIRGDA